MDQNRSYWTDSTPDAFDDQMEGGDVRELIRRGDASFAEGRLEEAEEFFKAALRIDPFEVKPHERLSMLYWHLQRVEDALDSLTKALELDPNDSEVVRRCIQIFRDLGRTSDAVQVATAFLERNPMDVEVRAMLSETPSSQPASNAPPSREGPTAGRFFLEHGEEQFSRGNLFHARACFELAIEQDPSLASAHNNLGVLSWQEGDLNLALEHFNRAFDLNPEDREIIFNSAKALQAAGQRGTAADLLKIYLGKDHRDPVWQDYDNLLRESVSPWAPDGLTAEVANVYARTSRLLAEAGDSRGALEALERAMAIGSGNLDYLCDLALLHAERGNASEAIDLLMEALERDPGHKGLLLTAGRILVAEERYLDARTLLENGLAPGADEEIETLLASIPNPEPPLG